MTHDGLIKIILEDVLNNLRIPIMWSEFANMNEEDENQAIEYERDHTSSDGEEGEKLEEEEPKEEEHEEEEEELQGEEAERDEIKDDEPSPKIQIKEENESPRVSTEPTKKEAATALTSLSTPIKSRGKRQRKTPLYFRAGRSTRIKQWRP